MHKHMASDSLLDGAGLVDLLAGGQPIWMINE